VAGLAALAAVVAPQARALAEGTVPASTVLTSTVPASTTTASTIAASTIAASTATTPYVWRVAKVFTGQPYRNLIPMTAISASDAWMFGDGANGREVALHWNGSTWTPSYPFGTLPRPWFVSATGHDNVWVTPQGCTSKGTGYLARYNGSKWTISTFAGNGGAFCQPPVVTTGPANGWIFSKPPVTTNVTKALHFTGGKLVPVTIGSFGEVVAASAVSASSIYLVTADNDTGKTIVVHYDGKAWRAVALPAAPIPKSQHVSGVAMTAVNSSNIWITADLEPSAAASAAVLLHYDGKKWQWIKDPYTGEFVTQIAYDAGHVWVSAIRDAGTGTGWDFQRWNGTQWSRVEAPSQGVPGTGVNYEIYSLVHIPGTHSFWANGDAAYDTASGAFAQKAIVFKFGP
jgi:hypothetical protein